MDTEEIESQGCRDEKAANGGDGRAITAWVLGLVGAVGGGVLGYFLFMWIAGYGFYAIVLPGALVGIGCGALSGRKSNGLGVVCGILGLAAGIFSEWRFAPFAQDDSLAFFLTHFQKNSPVTLVLIAIGGICAFYFGRGRVRRQI